ncbi:MAG: hypothetical protein ACT6RN_13795 [Agrobacterium sp.]
MREAPINGDHAAVVLRQPLKPKAIRNACRIVVDIPARPHDTKPAD